MKIGRGTEATAPKASLTVGCEFEVVRFAPLGDPIEQKVRGYHLSLRKVEAAGIQAERL